jgi:putative long chain acyl-CoA synthase
VTKALSELESEQRPDVVHVVEEIPLTAWYRPLAGPLREAGLPTGLDGRPAWRRDPASGGYEPLALAA